MLAVVRELAMTAAETGSPARRLRRRGAARSATCTTRRADEAAHCAPLDELVLKAAAVPQQKLAATQESELLDELARRVADAAGGVGGVAGAAREYAGGRGRARRPPTRPGRRRARRSSAASARSTLLGAAAARGSTPHVFVGRRAGGAVERAAEHAGGRETAHDATVALKEAAQTPQRATQALIAHTGGQPAALKQPTQRRRRRRSSSG